MNLSALLRLGLNRVFCSSPRLLFAFAAWCGVSSVGVALTFSFTNGPGLAALLAGSPAQQTLANNVITGFGAAGNLWSQSFVDPITVNIQIDFAALPPNVLGATGLSTQFAAYSTIRTNLIGDATTPADALAVANLPAGPALAFYTNNRAGVKFLDNDGSGNNTSIDLPFANAKALGLRAANDPAQDGSITFSSAFTWHFNHSVPVPSGTNDFVGVAAHEIGHVLGFVSGVDDVDLFTGLGPNANVDLNGTDPGIGTLDPFRVFSVLDLYRHSAQANLISTDTLDLATGGVPFFSLDGTTSLATFSTGRFNGDGRQASHWKDNLGFGLLDPTLGTGEFGQMTPLDRLALDVIGYNLVPEPGTVYLAGVSLVGLMACAANRRRAARIA